MLNREGFADFDVRWRWQDGALEPGLTAVLRLQDEVRNLDWVLPPLLETLDHLVVVDHASSDGTAQKVREIATRMGALSRLRMHDYPHPVSRCGSEYRATPADSVHSLTHFYNWSFAHVSTAFSLKWDGDMVLTDEGATTLASLAWQLEATPVVVAFRFSALYVVDEAVAYLDVAKDSAEPWIYPMGPEFVYVKGFDWEVRQCPDHVERMVLPPGLCFELKWLDEDEFSHWSSPAEFHPRRNARKVREHQIFQAHACGRIDEVGGLVRIQAPPGRHVVDHVVKVWLPGAPRPLSRAAN